MSRKFFNKKHEALKIKYPLYDRWHTGWKSSIVHWLIFLFLVFISGWAIRGQSKVLLQEADKGLPVAVVSKVQKYAPDRVLVKFKDNAGQDKRAEMMAKHSLKEKSEIKGIGIKILTVPQGKDP